VSTKAYQKYPIFLSSLCRDLEDLRSRIFEDAGQETKIYVDEKVKWRNTRTQDDLEAADELIKRVRESDLFICVLGGRRHGFPIRVDTRQSVVSFFEIELFQAALLEKEIYFFVRDDFDPEPKLKNLLQILKFAFPEWISQDRLTDAEILDRIKGLIDRKRAQTLLWPLRVLRAPINRLVQALFSARGRPVPHTPLFFLEGQFESRSKMPDHRILAALYGQITSSNNVEKRLSMLWIGLRELMATPYAKVRDKKLLEYWNKLLGQWASAGAWYGLHGDTPLGCLAALNSMAEVRSYLENQFGGQLPAESTTYPGGALASAKYSIAKRLYVKSDRELRFNEALNDIERTLQFPASDEGGLRAIRGSIFRELGRITEAIDDYEAVFRMRERKKAPESAVGEALSELGYGCLRQGHFLKGLRYCEEGVRLLRRGATAGFLARGLKKLSVAYFMNGKIIKAYETRREGRQVVSDHGVYDQL